MKSKTERCSSSRDVAPLSFHVPSATEGEAPCEIMSMIMVKGRWYVHALSLLANLSRNRVSLGEHSCGT